MTALTQYAKLESWGLWRPDTEAQRRDVAVSFGEATLIIRDNAGRPLAHWSLPAVERLNPGERPAVFAPDEAATETLEIDDDTMIDAIEQVRKSVARQRPHPGRLRWLGLGISVSLVVGLGVFWLPNAVRHQAMNAVPETKRAEIGAALLGNLQRLTGTACRDPLGVQSLRRLTTRVLGEGSGAQVIVVPDGVRTIAALPGNVFVMNKALVEDYEEPAVPAGYLLAAMDMAEDTDPLRGLIDFVGLSSTFQLLTTGDLPNSALRAYAEQLVVEDSFHVDIDSLSAKFTQAQITARPFAFAVDITGETTIDLIEADVILSDTRPAILSDGDWVALQGICGG